MYLNLGICMILKDFKLIRVEDVDFDSTVDDFKNKVAEKINFLKENIELAYCGEMLNDYTTLRDYGLKEGFVVNVLQKKDRELPVPPAPVLDSEIPDIVRVFQILATRNAYRRILQKLNKPDVLENIISTTPGLSDDATAIVILQHPELLAKLGDVNAVKRVVEKHPALANAARNLVAAVQNDMLTSPSTSISSQNLSNSVSYAVGSDDEEMELMGNGDSEPRTLENSDDGEHPVNLITTSQVAAALANTAATTTTVHPPSQTAASSSATLPGITPEMMSAALQQAIASTSTASTVSTNTAPSNSSEPPSDAQDGAITLAKLDELRKLGFTNDAINIQALQIANGDLEMAVNLILTGLSDDN